MEVESIIPGFAKYKVAHTSTTITFAFSLSTTYVSKILSTETLEIASYSASAV